MKKVSHLRIKKTSLTLLAILAIFLPLFFLSLANALSCSVNNDCGQQSSQLACDKLYIFNVTTLPTCLSGTCFFDQSWAYNSYCDFGCLNGACTNNCSVDNDCGIDYYTDSFCLETNLYKDFHDFSCDNGTCKKIIYKSLFENCNNLGCINNSCVKPRCGDGIIQENEQCDDGNNVNNDGCNFICIKEICGDGIIQELIGEECEPPNTIICDKYCKTIKCKDSDNDGICNYDDICPETKSGEEVDEYGCSNPQFCRMQGICGDRCDSADWKNNEPGKDPNDCLTIIIHKSGIPEPYCAGLSCAD